MTCPKQFNKSSESSFLTKWNPFTMVYHFLNEKQFRLAIFLKNCCF